MAKLYEAMSSRIQANMALSPKSALQLALRNRQEALDVREKSARAPELEAVILTDWDASRRYAAEVIQGRWPEFEAIVASSEVETDRTAIRALVGYAKKIVGGSWEAAEKHISTDPEVAFDYAVNVSRRPFDIDHPAHRMIMSSALHGSYADHFEDMSQSPRANSPSRSF